MKKSDYQQWVRDRLRMAGEELIRRSENFSTSGLDMMTDIDIGIHIPTYGEHIEVPSIEFSFRVINKVAADWHCGRYSTDILRADLEGKHGLEDIVGGEPNEAED